MFCQVFFLIQFVYKKIISGNNITINGGNIGAKCWDRLISHIYGSGIWNSSTGEITIDGGEVYGELNGICNDGKAIIRIKTGKVYTTGDQLSLYYQSKHAIRNIGSDSVIIIGDENAEVNTNNPIILTENTLNPGLTIGGSQLKFYNGIIQSGKGYPVTSKWIIRSGYSIEEKSEQYVNAKGRTITLYSTYLVKN